MPVWASASVASHSMSSSMTERTASMSRRVKPSYAMRSLSVRSLKGWRAYLLGECETPTRRRRDGLVELDAFGALGLLARFLGFEGGHALRRHLIDVLVLDLLQPFRA